MAKFDSRLRIIIEAMDRATPTLDRTIGGLERVEKRSISAGERLLQIGAIVGTVAGGLTVLGIAGRKAFEFAKQGAEIQLAEDRFRRLSDQMGISNQFLSDMRIATGGVRSEYELMTSSVDIMRLGLVKNEDELRRLVEVSGELGFDMNELVLTLTNQTTRRFDQLGVGVDGFKERLADLKAAGLDTNEAFTEAFLQQAEAQVLKVGSIADSAAGSYMRLEAEGTDAWIKLKKEAGNALEPIIKGLADSLEFQRVSNEAIKAGAITEAEWADIVNSKFNDMGPIIEEAGGKIAYMQQRIEEHRAVLEADNEVIDGWNTKVYDMADAAGAAAEEVAKVTVSARELTAASIGQRAMKELDQALADGKITQEDYNAAAKEVMGTLLGMSPAQIEANFMIEDLTAAFQTGQLPLDNFIGGLEALNSELERLSGLSAQELFFGNTGFNLPQIPGGYQGVTPGTMGGSATTNNNMSLTINSQADSEDLQGQFQMMKAISAGAN